MTRITELKVGKVKVTALKDGELSLPAEVLLNLSKVDRGTIESDEKNSLSLSNINAYLVQSGEKNLLIDAGCRDLFGPTCGYLCEALEEAGLKPKDITDVFLTHLHPDHMAGVIDTGGTSVFKNAILKVMEVEYDFWRAENFEAVEVNGADWASLAKSVIASYSDRLEILQKDSEVISGVSVISIPGHTPGHAGFRVDDGEQSLIHLGDIIHVPNLQLFDVNISTVFDIDREIALKSRKEMLDMASTDKILCTSGHMLSPKFGHIEKVGSKYAVV